MKKLVLVLVAVLVVMAGCGASSSDDVTLSFVWWGGEERHEKTLEMVDLYNSTHEGVTIEPEYYSYDGLDEKFPVMMVGGTEPDIMQVNYSWVYKFAGENGDGFYNLNDLSDELGLENWSQEDLEAFTVNGNLMAVPNGFTARMYGYNKNVVEQAGITLPTTWEEVKTANEQLRSTMGDNYYLLGDATNNKSLMYIMITYLNQTLDKEFIVDKSLNYTTEDLTKGFEFIGKLQENNIIPDVATDSREFDAENPNFINGNYTGISEWSSSIGKYEGNLEEGNEILIGDFISSTDSKKVMLKPSMGFAISKSCEHPEEAAEFINWMYTDPEALAILGTERGVPSNTVAYNYLKDNGVLTEQDLQIEELINNADTIYLSPYYEEPNVVEAYDTALDKFLYGELTAQEAAQEMEDGVSEALANL